MSTDRQSVTEQLYKSNRIRSSMEKWNNDVPRFPATLSTERE